MQYEHIATVASAVLIFLGAVLTGTGLHARRRGRLRYRQGAQVLAGLVVALGVGMVLVGGMLLI